MKKVILIAAALATGLYFLNKKNGTSAILPSPANPMPLAAQYNRTHVTALNNGYSLVVHDGVLYYDDKPGYIEQYFAQFGQKEASVPSFEDFSSQFPVQKSLSELFA